MDLKAEEPFIQPTPNILIRGLMVSKQAFDEHLKKAKKILHELRARSDYNDIELAVKLRDAGVWPTAISKLLKISGHQIPPRVPERTVQPEDLDRAQQVRDARKDSRKPIIAKEIESTAWFHGIDRSTSPQVLNQRAALDRSIAGG